MAISKARKEELIAQYKQLIEDSQAIFITEYGGMSVKEMETLRAKLRESGGAFYVTKNTLLKLAMEETNTPIPEELMQGQIGTGFALGEAPSLAKAMVDFADDDDKLVLKGGIMEGNLLNTSEIEALAKLPTLDELRAQLLGILQAPARDIASVVASGVRQVVNVVDAYAKSGDEGAETAEAA